MRKLIITGMALAMLAAIPAAASANVAVNDQGVGTVDKGDVQTVLGFNDAAMQDAWSKHQVNFTHKTGYIVDYTWDCNDGSNPVMTLTPDQTQTVNVAPNTNKAGKLTGFTLNGNGTTTYGQSTLTGAGFLVCGPIVDGKQEQGRNFRSSITPVDGTLMVNGKSLPNTPVL
jgi:hypothetical protein